MSREQVTVVIPTYNVASFIRPTLEALRWADQVIIVDMFSDDETEKIVTSFPNVQFVQRKDYIFGNVNHGFSIATTPWVIRLDSDEVIGEELKDNILKFLENPPAGINTVQFRGIHWMFGFPVNHGVFSPEYCWREHMFRRGTASYPVKNEHEAIEFQPGVAKLEGVYHHYTNMTTQEIIRKFNYYTTKDVERVSDAELRPLPMGRLIYQGIRMFILYYFQWKGYKDGALGLYVSLFRGPVYLFIEQAKYWERVERIRRGEMTEIEKVFLRLGQS